VRGALATALRVALIVIVALAIQVGAIRAMEAFRARIAARDDASSSTRFQTLARVFRYLLSVTLFVVGGSLVLDELGISVAPILATAGVAGVAIGFGAQAFVRDYLTGLLLLFEDQLRQGEVVRIGAHAGLVEEVTLRYVRLRDVEGKVVFVPSGEIKTVENLTRGFAQPLVEVSVSYATDLGHALAVLGRTLVEARAESPLGARIVEEPEILGVQELGPSGVLLRARVKVVPPIEQWNVKRALLRKVKEAFDREGIEIVVPQMAVTIRERPAATAGKTQSTPPAA
jgi:small conductance mechanosensitive channel